MRKPHTEKRFLVEFRTSATNIALMQATLINMLTRMNEKPPAGFDPDAGDYIRIRPVGSVEEPPGFMTQ